VLVVLAFTITTAALAGSGSAAGAASATSGGCTVNGAAATMTVTTPGKSAKCTFHGTTGQMIDAAITNVTTSDNGCEKLSLATPHGQIAGYQTGCGNGNPVGVGPVTLTSTGTWAVLLQLDTTATGSARLWVSAPASTGTVTLNGPAVPLEVAHPGREPELTFHGKTGQQVEAAITKVKTSDNGCEKLSLASPHGQIAGYQTGCGNGNPVGVGPVTLTSTGTWAVLLQIDTIATGSCKLKVSTKPAARAPRT
jgi:hypothetical protein